MRALAERFGVRAGWAWKISALRRRTGKVERPQQRHGPMSRVTPAVEGRRRELVRVRSDVTLAELQQQLRRGAQARTVEVLATALAQALSASTPQNASAWFVHCGYAL